MSLRHHLRAHQDIELASSERTQHSLVFALGAGRVAVQPRNPRSGKFLAQALFELFSALPEEVDVL